MNTKNSDRYISVNNHQISILTSILENNVCSVALHFFEFYYYGTYLASKRKYKTKVYQVEIVHYCTTSSQPLCPPVNEENSVMCTTRHITFVDVSVSHYYLTHYEEVRHKGLRKADISKRFS